MSWGPSRDLWGPRLHPAMSSVLVGGNCRNILFPVLSTVAEYAFSSHVYGSIFLVREDEERAKSVLELYLLASWRRRLHPFVADGEFFYADVFQETRLRTAAGRFAARGYLSCPRATRQVFCQSVGETTADRGGILSCRERGLHTEQQRF